MEQNNPILKLFSLLSGVLDKPPDLTQNNSEKKEKKQPVLPKRNKACDFMSSHEKLSKKIKKDNG